MMDENAVKEIVYQVEKLHQQGKRTIRVMRWNINLSMARERNCDIELLKGLYKIKGTIFNLCEKHIDDPLQLRCYHKMLHQVDNTIQEAWNFPQNENYHKFWYWPGCQCPALDNEDHWGSSRRIYSSKCPIHGIDN